MLGLAAHPAVVGGYADHAAAAAAAAVTAVPVAGTEPGALEWNYVKFLVNRQGRAIARYKPAFADFEADVSAFN